MARTIRVVNRTRNAVLSERVAVAGNPWTRFVGLMGRAGLEPDSGLQILPCSSVHMFFMRFPLDILYLDRDNRVVKAVAGLKPWRISAARGARSVLELPAGTITRSGTCAGDELALE